MPATIVWLSAGGFFLCFGGAALSTYRKNGNLGMHPVALLALALYSSSLIALSVIGSLRRRSRPRGRRSSFVSCGRSAAESRWPSPSSLKHPPMVAAPRPARARIPRDENVYGGRGSPVW